MFILTFLYLTDTFLREDCDPSLPLQVVAVQDQVTHDLVVTEQLYLIQDAVYKRSLAVVDVRYHGNISDIFRMLLSLGCKIRKRIVTPDLNGDKFLQLWDIYHFTGHASVNYDVLTVDEFIAIAAEKQACICYVFRPSDPAGKMLTVILCAQCFVITCLYPSRADAVDPDTILCQ